MISLDHTLRLRLHQGKHLFPMLLLILTVVFLIKIKFLVVRKFTPSDDFTAAATPNGLGGVALKGDETWDTWTLPNASTSGSSMYTIDTVAKTITMSSSSSDYVYSRTNSDGSTTDINLPIFSSSDTIYILRKTYITQPFVTWQSGSRFTSSQLNHEVKQLLNTYKNS